MMLSFIPLGSALPDMSPAGFVSERARRTLAACAANKAFKLIELRRYESKAGTSFDVIVVDCINDQVPTRNKVGIMPRERLALLFPHDDSKQPEVRALRADFPAVLHLNHVDAGEPSSLCVYVEKWERTSRTWTPQKYLQRISGWLGDTSRGELHRPDQPVEQIYFEPFLDLVLPPDFEARAEKEGDSLALTGVERSSMRQTLRAEFAPGPLGPDEPTVVPMVLTPAPIVHGQIERHPDTLGTLNHQLERRGSGLIEPLRTAVQSRVSSKGIVSPAKQSCAVILRLPIQREATAGIERTEIRGFLVRMSLASLGEAIGVLHRQGARYYAAPLIGESSNKAEGPGWHDIPLLLVDVKMAATRKSARITSACPEAGADAPRILAGVGALGSALADLWAREGWGRWTFVDPDYVQPHNVVRHIAVDQHVGFYKSDVVKALTDGIYQAGDSSVAIRDTVTNDTNAELQKALQESALLVDATTTLEAPRDLAQRQAPRSVSVFLNPRGSDSVLLLEDAERKLRLDMLEAQYYAVLLGSEWGEGHLDGNLGRIGVGAGCRDVSFVMSAESVNLHAAILARQVRELSAQNDARVRVWRAHGDGSVQLLEVPVSPAKVLKISGWRVVSHEAVEAKMVRLRGEHLPRETGGIILGYVDHQLKSIFVVDLLPAPADSEASESGFVRGVEGLEDAVKRAGVRTASIVGYIGEWHSHPPFHSARPSDDDQLLLEHLRRVLMRDGEPALMVIVGSANELSFSIREETAS